MQRVRVKISIGSVFRSTCLSLLMEALSGGLVSPLTAEPLQLRDILQRAEMHSALVRDFNALRESAESKLAFAQMNRWVPQLELKAFTGVVPDAKLTNPSDINSIQQKNLNTEFSFSELGPFFKMQLEALQPLYTFGKIDGYVSMARHNLVVSNLESQKKLLEVRSLVKRAYYTLLISNDSIDILNDVDKKLQDAADKVEELLIKNADNVSETDRLKIRVFTADVRNRRLDADRGQRLARSALGELMGISGDWTLGPQELTAEESNQLKRDDIISAALRAKPELAQLDQVVKIKEGERKTIQADLFPTFFIAGKIDYAKTPGRTEISNPFVADDFNKLDFGAVLGLKQDLGLFRTFKKLEGIDADIERLKAQRDQLAIKIKLDAERSFEEAVSAQQAISINEDGFRAARSWLTSAALAFNLGTSETKDILESYAAYFKARVDLLKSIYTLNLALADLSQVTGVEVVDRLR